MADILVMENTGNLGPPEALSDYDPDTEEAVVDQGYSDFSSAIIPHISDSQMAPVWQVSLPSVIKCTVPGDVTVMTCHL